MGDDDAEEALLEFVRLGDELRDEAIWEVDVILSAFPSARMTFLPFSRRDNVVSRSCPSSTNARRVGSSSNPA